jgi:hypothetical protein
VFGLENPCQTHRDRRLAAPTGAAQTPDPCLCVPVYAVAFVTSISGLTGSL